MFRVVLVTDWFAYYMLPFAIFTSIYPASSCVGPSCASLCSQTAAGISRISGTAGYVPMDSVFNAMGCCDSTNLGVWLDRKAGRVGFVAVGCVFRKRLLSRILARILEKLWPRNTFPARWNLLLLLYSLDQFLHYEECLSVEPNSAAKDKAQQTATLISLVAVTVPLFYLAILAFAANVYPYIRTKRGWQLRELPSCPYRVQHQRDNTIRLCD